MAIRRAIASLTLIGLSVPCVAATEADLVVQNARVFTEDPRAPWVAAIAVQKGKILATGSNAEITAYVGAHTKKVDAAGQLVIPGLIDGHVHVQAAALDLANYNCVFSQYSTFDEMIAAVSKCVSQHKPGEWIVGMNWNSTHYERLKSSSALKALDAVSPNNPVILTNDTRHDAWVNSVALKSARIDRNTQDPARGIIGRDPSSGELNGLLIESPAVSLVRSLSPSASNQSADIAAQVEQLRQGATALNRFGVTGWIDAAVDPERADLYKKLDEMGKLHARVGLSMLIDPNSPLDLPALYARVSRDGSAHIDTHFAKIFLDGVMVSHTSMFLEPYLPDKEHGSSFKGPIKVEQALLSKTVTALDRMNISVKMHASGDGAVNEALNAVEAARQSNGKSGPMHSVAHGGYVAPADIKRYAQLRVSPDASPTVWYPGPILDGTVAAIGKERAYRYWPIKTMLKEGVLVSGGTDWKTLPDEYSSLWDGIEGMVTRRNPTGKIPGVLGPEEAVDVATAIRLYSLNTARLMKIDDVAGSIEPGKSADFIVLSQDIFKVDPSCISETKVMMTVFEGQMVHRLDPKDRPAVCKVN